MHDRSPKSVLIAIGLTSGLGSIACSVLSVADKPEELWSEVMPGPRKKRGVDKYRSYRAHYLMFQVLFERWPPSIIALGPPSEDDEPLEWVTFMRSAVFELGKSIRVPVQLFDTEEDIARGLGAPDLSRGNGLKTLVRRRLPSFTSNKHRVIVSTAAAMAGARHIRLLQGNQ